jgi:hypothetical protein
MDDKSLRSLWKEETPEERAFLESHRGQFEKMAQRKSQDVFARIKRNIILEGACSLAIAVIFPFFFLSQPFFFWLVLSLMVVSTINCFWYYDRYLRGIRSLQESSLLDSLNQKAALLQVYVRRMKWIGVVYIILGYGVGLSFALAQGEIYPLRLIVLGAISIPIIVLLLWLANLYIRALYGKHLKEILKLKSDLQGQSN